MELAGIHLAIGPLLPGCYKIVTTVNQLHQSYKFLPMTLANIVAACNLTRITLGQLDSALAKDFDIVEESNKELVEQFDGTKIGCTITLSLLEKQVTQLLNIAGSEVPLKAQHTSRTGKWKALYNESDMKELLGQLKDNDTLLNTILNVLQRDQQRVSMSKQDKMMDMMANQEKTLQNMLRARGSFRKYLQDAKVPLDSEVASILTASTSSTVLTAFDFDSIIMRTSVYKRCMARGSDNNELLISLQHLATNPAMVGPRSRLAVGSGQPQSASQVDANNGRPLDSISLLVAQTGKVIRALHAGSSKEFEAIAFSSDNHVLACSLKRGMQRKIALYATATGQIIKTIPSVCKWSVTLSFVSDQLLSDQLLLIGSTEKSPRLWNMTKCTFDDDLRIPDVWNTSSLVVTRTGMIIAVYRPGQLVMNDLHSNDQVAGVNVGRRVRRLICSEATELVAFVYGVKHDRRIGIWNPRTGKVSEVMLSPEVKEKAIALYPDGSTLSCGTKYGAVMAWDIDISGNIGQCRKFV